MGNTWRAPEPTDEQKRADELKAAGLMRDSFNGQIRPIPEPGKPKTQEELDAGWAAIREQAAANTARREDAERVQRAGLAFGGWQNRRIITNGNRGSQNQHGFR